MISLSTKYYKSIPVFLPPPSHPFRSGHFYSILVAQAIMGCPSIMSSVMSPMTKPLKWLFHHGMVKCKRPFSLIKWTFTYPCQLMRSHMVLIVSMVKINRSYDHHGKIMTPR